MQIENHLTLTKELLFERIQERFKVKTYTRKAKMTELKPYCHHADDNDFIEVTEWENGEGFDVTLSTKSSDEKFTLTWGQFEALQAVVAYRG